LSKVVLAGVAGSALLAVSCGGVADGVSPPEPAGTGSSTTIETEISATVTVSPTATAVSVPAEPPAGPIETSTTVDHRRMRSLPAG
jgi:hypothetical protein